MGKNLAVPFLVAACSFFVIGASAAEAPLSVPFDYSRSAIGLDVTVKGTPLYMLLDTGVDPSAVDSARAEALHLHVDRSTSGEASGEGDATHAQIYAATIEGLGVGGRTLGSVDALAMDMSALSVRYGRKLDGILGYSFLSTRIVLIDYPNSRLSILSRAGEATGLTRGCRQRYAIPLRSFEGDTIPVIPDFRFGAATAPITLDTGSNGGISLYAGAFDVPAIRAGYVETGETSATGARGNTTTKTGTLNLAVGFGPFSLPAGQPVTLAKIPGSADTRLANIGNKLFAAMGLKMLLDYPGKTITFYGTCPD
jgi:hypothetical protein